MNNDYNLSTANPGAVLSKPQVWSISIAGTAGSNLAEIKDIRHVWLLCRQWPLRQDDHLFTAILPCMNACECV
jgi:hypothetical protein